MDIETNLKTSITSSGDSSNSGENKYCILVETSAEEYEQWYSFIKWNGNESNIKKLSSQLEKIDWHICDDLSTFDLEIDYLVSETTAKEMTKIDINAHSFHRKFDGILQEIDFDLKKKDSNITMMSKVYDLIGDGGIEEFAMDEDIDEEDINTDDESVSEDGKSCYSSDSDSESDEDTSSSKHKKLPPSVLRERLREQIKEKEAERKKGKKHDSDDE